MDCFLWFFDLKYLIDFDIFKELRFSRGPFNLNFLYHIVFSKSEMDSGIILRQITGSTFFLSCLHLTPGG